MWRLDTNDKKLNDKLRYQKTNKVDDSNNVTEIRDNQTQPIQFRSLQPYLLNPETENFFIGSIIISQINHYDLPRDVAILAYPGSMTDEKMKRQEYLTHTKTNNCERLLSRME